MMTSLRGLPAMLAVAVMFVAILATGLIVGAIRSRSARSKGERP